MKITVDYHGVLQDHPQMFHSLCLFYDLYVVSGASASKEEILDTINKNQIIYQEILTAPKTNCDKVWEKANEWKVDTVEKLNPTFHFDDEEYILREIYKRRGERFTTTPIHIKSTQEWAL